jgi:3-isopropylmalate/(R)-2-methylmalate dehydratase large subunit
MNLTLGTTRRTLFEKIWDQHVVMPRAAGPSLLYIDRHILHEGSFHAFKDLRARGLSLRNPKQVFGVADHYVPTTSRDPNHAVTSEIKEVILKFDDNMTWSGAHYFSIKDPQQGIVHVVGPEQGISLPGSIITCSDSHTSTHGALGAMAFGVGQSESTHILATQTLWQTKPLQMRIELQGKPASGVGGKDIILAVIAKLGVAGAVGYAIEYAGSALQWLSLDERLTICNMTIEAGARSGLIAADDLVFDYLYGRNFAPKDAAWEHALREWRQLPSDDGCHFDNTLSIDVSQLSPMLTWGTTPDSAVAIDGLVPDPSSLPEAHSRQAALAALAYMDLTPGTPLSTIKIDRVFIGSCTNSRLSDLRLAADILRGRRAVVPGIVVAGSMLIKQAAEAEGLDKVFQAAGLEWREPGCSMCVGINGDLALANERVASTSNRNFVGRQGPGVRTHLVSPAMAAAAAVTGHFTDVRTLLNQK